MNLQHERLSHLRAELRLSGVAVAYPDVARKAVETEASVTDFLAAIVRGELETRCARARTMPSGVAAFVALKTLDQFEFEFAVGAPKHQVAKCCERGSIVLTSNLTFGSWDQALAGCAVVTAAMRDRLMHHATVVQIGGDSYRLRDKRKGGLVPKSKSEPT